MADFFTGNSIVKSYDTNKGMSNGWLPINGSQAVPMPECDSKYWKLNSTKTKILEMTASEKDAVDNPPAYVDPRISLVDNAEADGTFTTAQADIVRQILGG